MDPERAVDTILHTAKKMLKELHMATADYGDSLSYAAYAGSSGPYIASTNATDSLWVTNTALVQPVVDQSTIDEMVQRKIDQMVNPPFGTIVKKPRRTNDPLKELRDKVAEWLRPAMLELCPA